jgi:hypothetical protein
MKKIKLNKRRYLKGREPAAPQEAGPAALPVETMPDETMVEHVREMVSMIEGRRITREEAIALIRARMKKRETTPP